MRRNKNKKPLSRFLKIYFSVFAVILISIVGILYIYLEDYQKTLPSEKGVEVIQAIENLDMVTLEAISSNLPLSLKDKKYFSQYLKSFGEEPDLFFYASTSKDENKLVYLIGNHDKTMATLTLEKTGEKSRFGFDKVRILDLVFKPVKNPKIIVMTPVDLLINETPFTSQIQEVKSTLITNFAPAVKEIEILTYSFPEFQFITSVTVPNHPEVEVNFDPVSSTYMIMSTVDQTTKDNLSAFAEKAIKDHTRLWKLPSMTRSAFINDYVYPKSNFDSLVRSYDLMVKYDFISETFSDFKIQEICQFGPNAFSAHVSISHSVTSTYIGKIVTQVSHPSYLFYFTNLNGKWKVTDMILKASE